jgi:hypothetical protein
LNQIVTQEQAKNISALYEEYLLEPCKTKEELNQWIQTYLNISFPNCTLDENSTSNPLDFIWDVYSAVLYADTTRTTFVGAAARASMKTLSVSVLEFLLMLHFGKTIVHLSAILDQSMACINYLDNFLALPSVKKFSKTDSQRKKILRGLPPSKYRQNIPASLRVLVATKESANGMRGNVLCVPGNTKITIDSGYCTARDLYNSVQQGVEVNVLTFNPALCEFEYKRVTKAYTRQTPERVKIITKHGSSVTVTPEHPVAVYNKMRKTPFEWVKAADLDILDCVYEDVADNAPWPCQISDLQKYEDPNDLDVFDFTVEDNHNFFANDMLVHNCFDETDLIDPSILSEAAMIADPDQLGRPPIFIYISSRKSAFGPVQDKIDASNNPESGIRLHKWSLCDFMQPCKPEVYKPDEPTSTIYIHRDSLEIKSHEEFVACPETVQLGFDPKVVFAGCVTCPALLVCQSRAVNQKSQDSKALRDIAFVKTVLRETRDPEKIKAQLLNLKPESSGNVFNRMDRARNTGTIHQAWEYAFSVPLDPDVKISKRQLADALRANEWFLTCGVDFGYVDPAVSILVAYHRAFDKLLLIHTIKAPGFSNPDWLAYTKERVYVPYGFNLLCPDTADKSAPTTAAKLGMQSRSRKPHRIEAGVSFLRNHIWSPTQQKTNLFIIDDEFNAPVIMSLERYQYKRGPEGFVFDVYDPDSPWSHEIDALRYACDPWVVYGQSQVSANQPKQQTGVPLYFEHQKAKEEELKKERKYLMGEIRQHYSDEYRLSLDIPEEHVDNETEGSPTLFFSF